LETLQRPQTAHNYQRDKKNLSLRSVVLARATEFVLLTLSQPQRSVASRGQSNQVAGQQYYDAGIGASIESFIILFSHDAFVSLNYTFLALKSVSSIISVVSRTIFVPIANYISLIASYAIRKY
jgi:hypothetical protein